MKVTTYNLYQIVVSPESVIPKFWSKYLSYIAD